MALKQSLGEISLVCSVTFNLLNVLVVLFEFGTVFIQREHLKIAQQYFQLVGGSASECGMLIFFVIVYLILKKLALAFLRSMGKYYKITSPQLTNYAHQHYIKIIFN